MIVTTRSPQETRALGAAVARQCRAGDVLALVGELGAGKTQFVQGLARGLGLAPGGSPTFVMVHEFPSVGGSPGLIHIDAYRLSSLEDLESIGWDLTDEMGRGNIVAVEWADRLGDLLAEDRLQLTFTHLDEQTRRIELSGQGAWRERVDTITLPWRCPICREWVSETGFEPFCSRRCKLADLGRWLKGDYVIR